MRAFERAIDRPVVVDLLAPLRRALDAAERATHDVDLGALIGEAVLHQQIDGAAERVEAEGGIVGDDRGRTDRRGRDRVPVHGVGKRLVDAHAVLVDGEALRRAGQRRGDIAAKLDVGLERIAGDFAEIDAGNVLLKRIADVQRAGALYLGRIDRIDARRDLVDIDAAGSAGRGRVDVDPGGRGLADARSRTRHRPRRRAPCGWLRRHHLDRRQVLDVGLFVLRSASAGPEQSPDTSPVETEAVSRRRMCPSLRIPIVPPVTLGCFSPFGRDECIRRRLMRQPQKVGHYPLPFSRQNREFFPMRNFPA